MSLNKRTADLGVERSPLRKLIWLLVTATLCTAPESSVALKIGSDDWQLHGFLSQGFTYTSDNQVFGDSRNGSVDFTEIGMTGSVRLLPSLLISAQGLYRRAGESDRQGLRLDFAQADYSISLLDAAATLGVRAGRVKVPLGLYNDTRDVIWTRPSVLLPQSIYFDTLGLRQAMISADGGIVYGRYKYGNHRFSAEFLAAHPQYNTGGATEFLTGIQDAPGSVGGRPALIGRAVYEWMGGRGRLMFSAVDLDLDFKSTSPLIPSGKIKAFYPLFSAQYNAERFSVTAEYGWIDSRRSGFVPRPLKNTSESFYVQGEYRFAARWTAVLRYDVFHANRNDANGRDSAALTGLPRHRFYTEDLMLGARWEFLRNCLIAAEYHRINGTAWLSTRDNPDLLQGGGEPNWDLFALMLSYRF